MRQGHPSRVSYRYKLIHTVFSLDFYGATHSSVKSVVEACRKALERGELSTVKQLFFVCGRCCATLPAIESQWLVPPSRLAQGYCDASAVPGNSPRLGVQLPESAAAASAHPNASVGGVRSSRPPARVQAFEWAALFGALPLQARRQLAAEQLLGVNDMAFAFVNEDDLQQFLVEHGVPKDEHPSVLVFWGLCREHCASGATVRDQAAASELGHVRVGSPAPDKLSHRVRALGGGAFQTGLSPSLSVGAVSPAVVRNSLGDVKFVQGSCAPSGCCPRKYSTFADC